MIFKPIILSSEANQILSILKDIAKDDEDNNTSLTNYPVLIGSGAAKWHISSFREPNDLDLIATPLQTISFINGINKYAIFKEIKLVYYPEGGLKIIAESQHVDGRKSIIFDIELISDKVDLCKMKKKKDM
ncbi:hypothetical protein GLOIN_2v1486458 [Rhizophagus clarus]|uniref:DUF7277 domain-containing protein n=1 Tax=Rhizophagus clarus TaxID=94130 RepID=A0A8H3KYS5_9GLOM|nr:hypothetical protein GLOIN_2v1486458 [Rhizophagus clarus]